MHLTMHEYELHIENSQKNKQVNDPMEKIIEKEKEDWQVRKHDEEQSETKINFIFKLAFILANTKSQVFQYTEMLMENMLHICTFQTV